MKGKDIIKLIQDRNLEDFDFKLSLCEVDERGINIRTFNIEGLCDIGYSSNSVTLDVEEEDK